MRGLVIWSAVAIATLLLLGTAGRYGLKYGPADFCYVVETDFDEIPASDVELEK